MRISIHTLLCLARFSGDREAQKAIERYDSTMNQSNGKVSVEIRVENNSYQIGVTPKQ